MSKKFASFVVFAEMRTGSNFLETNLNALAGLQCLGEVFNPHFIGYPNQDDVLGITLDERIQDPLELLKRIQSTPDTLSGFRFFHDHDPRILDDVLADPSCAKIILTRNPADSYVSWKIAQSTNQWKLTNAAKRKDARAVFDQSEFEQHVSKLQEFQIHLLNGLQKSGQTAFYIAYEDLQDLDIMNGLAKWLGLSAQLMALDDSLKRQNPAHISEKVSNFDAMQAGLAKLDQFNLTRTPNFEPRRGAVVPSYFAGAKTPLLFQPIQSAPHQEVCNWMAALDQIDVDALLSEFGQKTLRQWKRKNATHRSFTVLRHPLARAHHAFCTKILITGPQCYSGLRRTLKQVHKLPIPQELSATEIGTDKFNKNDYRTALAGFLKFLKLNLQGQTTIRVDGHWASQSQYLQGFAEFAQPDFVLREDELAKDLPDLAIRLGHQSPLPWQPEPSDLPIRLSDIYDTSLEELAKDAYQRDYMMFGFKPWRS